MKINVLFLYTILQVYRIAGKFDGELNLAVWLYALKFDKISTTCGMAILYHTAKFNYCITRHLGQTANISGYTICNNQTHSVGNNVTLRVSEGQPVETNLRMPTFAATMLVGGPDSANQC